MKYRCKQCGKIYNEYRPEFCDCGNDVFIRIKTEEEMSMYDYEYVRREKKESPVAIIIFFVVAGCFAYFLLTKIRAYQAQPEIADAYLTSVRQEMLRNFNPAGITRSGKCIISFEINEEGWVNKRHLAQRSNVPEMDDKIFDMLQSATLVPKPPLTYTNTPILIEFGCSANKYEVECYSKNIVSKK